MKNGENLSWSIQPELWTLDSGPIWIFFSHLNVNNCTITVWLPCCGQPWIWIDAIFWIKRADFEALESIDKLSIVVQIFEQDCWWTFNHHDVSQSIFVSIIRTARICDVICTMNLGWRNSSHGNGVSRSNRMLRLYLKRRKWTNKLMVSDWMAAASLPIRFRV